MQPTYPEKYKEHCCSGSKRRKKDPEKYYIKRREEGLKRNYNLTLEEYNNLLIKQNSNCAICGVNQSQLKKPLYVDHNHTTDKVRGLLCSRCNSAIGLMDDNLDIMNKAILYLTTSK